MPKIGVYICHCGTNIAGFADIDALVEASKKFDDVVVARAIDHYCDEAGQNEIKKDIRELNIDRVIIAACSPWLHENTFRRCVEDAGLNPYLSHMVNIREHCTWVHSRNRDAATQKSIDLIRMGVARARHLEPLKKHTAPVEKAVLVIGGGVAGIHASLDLAHAGIKVYLVEKSPSVGGHMALLTNVFPTHDCSICVLGPKMFDVTIDPNITLYTYSEVVGISGYVGNFTVRIKKKARFVDETKCIMGCIDDCANVCPVEVHNECDFGIGVRKAIYFPFPQTVPKIATVDPETCIGCKLCEEACEPEALAWDQRDKEFEVKVGAIIVTTGYDHFDARKKKEYGYGVYPNVITSLELERMLNSTGPTGGEILRVSDNKPAKKIAFIHCVGSRDEKVGNPYCSVVCCMASLKGAQLIKDRFPDVDLTLYYTDIRAAGPGWEEYYRRARDMGIKFIRGRVSYIEEVEDKKLTLYYENTLTGNVGSKTYDMVVLSVGLVPSQGSEGLAKIMNLARQPSGFFQVAHPKMRPVESQLSGVFVGGCAVGPKDIPYAIAQAGAAVSKALALVNRGEVELDPIRASVIESMCDGCRLCERVCEFDSVHIADKKAKVTMISCSGCGVCSSICPQEAIQIKNFTDEQIMAEIDACMEVKSEFPLVVAFLCNWCSYAAADLAGTSRIQYPTNVRIIRVMCSSRVDPKFIVRALKKGADGVLVAGCRLGECHYKNGNYRAKHRLDVLRGVLEASGIDKRRISEAWIAASECDIYSTAIKNFVDVIKALGPIGSEMAKVPQYSADLEKSTELVH